MPSVRNIQATVVHGRDQRAHGGIEAAADAARRSAKAKATEKPT
jgi:hypothetical protein